MAKKSKKNEDDNEEVVANSEKAQRCQGTPCPWFSSYHAE